MNSILLSRLLRRDFNFTEQFRFHAGIFHSHVSFWAVWNKSGKLCLLFAEKKENSFTSKSWSDASQYVDTSHQRIEHSRPNMKRFQVDSIHMPSGLIAHSTIIGRQTSQLKPSELSISLFLLTLSSLWSTPSSSHDRKYHLALRCYQIAAAAHIELQQMKTELNIGNTLENSLLYR